MAEEDRFCVFDDKPVKRTREAGQIWGNGPAQGEFVHRDGTPNCGRQFLTEDQTYTEVDSDRKSDF